MVKLVVRGARVHNLRNVSCELPRDALVVFSGPSGSGKSSLAFDTIFAESQRRFLVEALSLRARQFVAQLPKPDVDSLTGLSPALALDPRRGPRGPRSTVGTLTEVADFLRVLFARQGEPHCPLGGEPLRAWSIAELVDELQLWPAGARVLLLAPAGTSLPGDADELAARADELARTGFVRGRLDGVDVSLGEPLALSPDAPHRLEVVVDRLVLRPGLGARMADSLELALRVGRGVVVLERAADGERFVRSDRLRCAVHDAALPPLTPALFSFNTPEGACPDCAGLGTRPHGDTAPSVGVGDGDDESEDETDEPSDESSDETAEPARPDAAQARGRTAAALAEQTCATCEGSRLGAAARSVTFRGRTLPALSALSLAELTAWLREAAADAAEQPGAARGVGVAAELIALCLERLGFLVEMGLGYLTLARGADTLSGGEAQRLRLARQLGASLTGVLYVMDEPSAGLHPQDTERLLAALRAIIARGNSILCVEHDRDVIAAADYLVDVGPGAGELGGKLVACGSVEEVVHAPASVTGPYLSGEKRIAALHAVAGEPPGWLRIRGARANNLCDVSAEVPLGRLTVVTGVSGSGKSSLVVGSLLPAARGALGRPRGAGADPHSESSGARGPRVEGLERLDKAVSVDQSPLGRSPRSSPATATGVFALLRELFATLPEARARGYSARRFSYNVPGGRCEQCQGLGVTRVELHFLPDAEVPCPVCATRRYNRETLEVRYRGLSLADVLAGSVDEAAALFDAHPALRQRLAALRRVGLGYLRLGQAANTLSSGEAQRVKLAVELSRQATGRTLYVLDEPTTGLHFVDLALLLTALGELRDQGNTLVVIEHNVEVIASADWVLELGPGAGAAGGRLVAAGTPADLIANPASVTGKYLSRVAG